VVVVTGLLEGLQYAIDGGRWRPNEKLGAGSKIKDLHNHPAMRELKNFLALHTEKKPQSGISVQK
jgi:hypothetical protein